MLKKFFSKKTNLIATIALIAVVALGGVLRLWRLDTSPKGALVDELHFAYLAHSLIETGADEHGNKWPIIFEGFGDRKLPAMAYLDIPSVKVFGLSVMAIRVPSALAGILLILSSYWLLLEITRRKKWALLAALITAVSPWSFFLSRFGFESNLALLGLTTALASTFAAQRTKNLKLYILAAFGLAFSWYSYIAYRPVTAVLLLLFIVLKLIENFKENKKTMAIYFVAFAIFVAPLFAPSAISVNGTRLGQVGIGTESGPEIIINEKRNFCATTLPKTICYAAFNKPVFLFKELTHRYLMAFSPEFLVTKGELSTDFLTVDSFGQFYSPLYILFLFGIAGMLFLQKTKMTKIQKWIIVAGLLLAPIPSAMVGEPQKVRISSLYPFMMVFIVYGAVAFDSFLKHKVLKKLFYLAAIFVLLGYGYMYQMEYHGVNSIQSEYKYQSYLPEIHAYLAQIPKDEAIINIIPFHSDPLMFHAFYTKMDPREYQELAVLDEYDGASFRHTVELGNVWAHKYSPEKMSCLALEKGVKGIYVMDKKREDLLVLHKAQSTNGVNTYAYIYDVTNLMLERNCDEE